MISIDKLERTVKAASLILELAKSAVFIALATVVVGAVAAPQWIGGQIKALNMKIESIDLPFMKIVADETKASNAHTIQIAEALTKIEVDLAGDHNESKTKRALEAIRSAKSALDEQSKSIAILATKAGMNTYTPTDGWLYIGYYNELGALVRQSDRIAPDGVSIGNGKPSRLTLRYDAPLISDGDKCQRLDVSNFSPPDPKERKANYAIVQAASDPLQIISIVDCESVGRGKQKYARIAIPSDRIRFAELASQSR